GRRVLPGEADQYFRTDDGLDDPLCRAGVTRLRRAVGPTLTFTVRLLPRLRRRPVQLGRRHLGDHVRKVRRPRTDRPRPLRVFRFVRYGVGLGWHLDGNPAPPRRAIRPVTRSSAPPAPALSGAAAA